MGSLSNMKHKNWFIALLIFIPLFMLVLSADAQRGNYDCGDTHFPDPYCQGYVFEQWVTVTPRFEYTNLYACSRTDCRIMATVQADEPIVVTGLVWGMGFDGAITQWVTVVRDNKLLYAVYFSVKIN